MNNEKIKNELLQLGIYSNKKGYRNIIKIIDKFDYSIPIRDIYETVAKETGTKAATIERTARYAFKSANRDLPAWKYYRNGNVTLKEFIITMYCRTKEENANE